MNNLKKITQAISSEIQNYIGLINQFKMLH